MFLFNLLTKYFKPWAVPHCEGTEGREMMGEACLACVREVLHLVGV